MHSQWWVGYFYLVIWVVVGIIDFALSRLVSVMVSLIFPSVHYTVWDDAKSAMRYATMTVGVCFIVLRIIKRKG